MIQFINKKGGIDTSDATATANDILSPKTAYVNGEKIEGKIIPKYEIIPDTNLYKQINIGKDEDIITYPCRYSLSNDFSTLFVGDVTNSTIYAYSYNEEEGVYEYTGYKYTDSSAYRMTLQVIAFDFGYESNQDQCVVLALSYTISGLNNNVISTKKQLIYDKKNGFKYDMSKTFIRGYDHYDILHNTNKKVLAASGLSGNPLGILCILGDSSYYNTLTTSYGFTNPTKKNIVYLIFANANCYVAQNSCDWTEHSCVFLDNDQNMIFQIDSVKGGFLPNPNMEYVLYENKIKKFSLDLANKEYGFLDLEQEIDITSDLKMFLSRWLSNDVIAICDISNATYDEDSLCNVYIYKIDYENCTKELLVTDTMFYRSFFNATSSLEYFISNADKSALYGGKIYQFSSENTYKRLISMSRLGYTYHFIENATAKPSDILKNKTAYNENTKIFGTMPDNGELNYTPTIEEQTIPSGYTSGGRIAAVTSEIDSNIIPENIKEGVTILGVSGTLPAFDTSQIRKYEN